MKQKIIEAAFILIWFLVVCAIFYITFPIFQHDSEFAKLHQAIDAINQHGVAR